MPLGDVDQGRATHHEVAVIVEQSCPVQQDVHPRPVLAHQLELQVDDRPLFHERGVGSEETLPALLRDEIDEPLFTDDLFARAAEPLQLRVVHDHEETVAVQ